MIFRFPFRLLAAALIVALLPIAVLGTEIRAQTIDNIAQASWTFEGEDYSGSSNLVSLEVDRSDPIITIYRPTPGPGADITYRPPLCTANSNPAANTQPSAGQSALAVPEEDRQVTAVVETTDTVSPGGSILFEVVFLPANIDPAAIDQLEVTIVSSTGDREKLTIFETGENTGRFVGQITTHRTPPPPTPP